jgi:tRNA uridine 5-carbamoylmethylation protein Kti12
MTVLIIRGPLAVGKSTVAEQLAKKLDAEYISVDGVLENENLDKVERGEDNISLKNFIKVHDAVAPKVNKALKSNKTVIFEGNFYYKEQILDIANRFDNKLYVFTLKAPLKVCLRRDATRKKPHGEDAAKTVYSLVNRLNVGRSIDTTTKTPREVADAIAFYIKE